MKKSFNSFFPFLLLIFFGLFSTLQSQATVGGPQILQLLGFNESENSVLFLWNKQDAEGLPPRLWAFRLGSGEIEVVEDASKYHDNDGLPITTGLKALKETDIISPSMIAVDWQTPIEVNDTLLQFEYTLFPAKVKVADHSFDIVQCFKKDKPIEVIEQYHLEQSDLVFAIFRYFGVCFETGYTKDTLLVSTMAAIEDLTEQETEEVSDSLSENEADLDSNNDENVDADNYSPKTDYSLLWTLSLLILLAVVYLFLRLKSGRNRVGRRRRK